MIAPLLCALWAQATPAVAVDIRALQPQQYEAIDALKLERHLLARLVQEGFAVVSLEGSPDLRIVLQVQDEALKISVRTATAALSSRRVRVRPDSLAAMHFEVVQRAVQLVRQAPRRSPAQGPGAPRLNASMPKAEPKPAPPVRVLVKVPLQPPGEGLSASVGVGVIGRDQGGDLQLRLRGRYGFKRAPGLGLRVDAALAPPLASSFSVWEWQIQAGADYRIPWTSTWYLEVGALFGALIHRFSSPTTVGGVRADFLVSLPLSVGFRLGRWGAQLLIAPGLTEERREHFQEGTRLWSRGAVRITVAAAVEWSFWE